MEQWGFYHLRLGIALILLEKKSKRTDIFFSSGHPCDNAMATRSSHNGPNKMLATTPYEQFRPHGDSSGCNWECVIDISLCVAAASDIYSGFCVFNRIEIIDETN